MSTYLDPEYDEMEVIGDVLEGDRVSFVAVTGEEGIGTYRLTKDTTGSHLIEDVTLLNGRSVEYMWAESIQVL